MIRSLSLVVLLGASCIVLAQPLYKWAEPDGSITFSVKPPQAGVEFETIDAPMPTEETTVKATSATQAQMAPRAQEALPDGIAQEIPLATPQPSAQPRQRIAPQLGAQTALRPGIQRQLSDSGNDVDSNNSPRGTQRPDTVFDDHRRQDSRGVASTATKTRKQQQCEDLKKRVVSLEGRLRNRLTPEDMDNTVIHMAQYQRSYDQHCVQ